METIQKPLSPEERQANVDRFIKRWKEERAKVEEEAKSFIESADFKETLKILKTKNAERGITIPGV
jgi:hypothetical protein